MRVAVIGVPIDISADKIKRLREVGIDVVFFKTKEEAIDNGVLHALREIEDLQRKQKDFIDSFGSPDDAELDLTQFRPFAPSKLKGQSNESWKNKRRSPWRNRK